MLRVKGTTEDAAKDIAAFIAIFFEHFSYLGGRALHVAGESYGVRALLMNVIRPLHDSPGPLCPSVCS